MDTRYLDDLFPGQHFKTPGITLTEADIIDFALRYDPQPFHLDVNAAAESRSRDTASYSYRPCCALVVDLMCQR